MHGILTLHEQIRTGELLSRREASPTGGAAIQLRARRDRRRPEPEAAESTTMADDDAPAREEVHEPEASPGSASSRRRGRGRDRASASRARSSSGVHGQPVVYVDRSVFAEVAGFLRDEQQFTMCVDVTATDHLLDGERHASRLPGVDAPNASR